MKKIHISYNNIKNWAEDDRPREKLLRNGPSSLSNCELLAILINNGTKSKSAIDLAREILNLSKNNLNELGKLTSKELQKVKGIGIAKAVSIGAAMELGRRRERAEAVEKYYISDSRSVVQYLKSMLQDEIKEVFVVLYLNAANKINSHHILSIGGITGTIADPRLILKKAIEESATGIVLSHNHPSGTAKPSKCDIELTQKIKSAARFFDIKTIDHIIIGNKTYYSFADHGIL